MYMTNYSLFISIFLISAVKCNDNLMVIEVLAALGVSFDCASKVNMTKLEVYFY